jgi:hypothetical protein
MSESNNTSNVDLGLDRIVSDLIDRCQSKGRGEMVYDMLNTIKQRLQDKGVEDQFYILILSLTQSQSCQPHLQGVSEYTSFHWKQGLDAHTFGVWVFKSGWIDHTREDGGWINWAFTGGERSGNRGGFVRWS